NSWFRLPARKASKVKHGNYFVLRAFEPPIFESFGLKNVRRHCPHRRKFFLDGATSRIFIRVILVRVEHHAGETPAILVFFLNEYDATRIFIRDYDIYGRKSERRLVLLCPDDARAEVPCVTYFRGFPQLCRTAVIRRLDAVHGK